MSPAAGPPRSSPDEGGRARRCCSQASMAPSPWEARGAAAGWGSGGGLLVSLGPPPLGSERGSEGRGWGWPPPGEVTAALHPCPDTPFYWGRLLWGPLVWASMGLGAQKLLGARAPPPGPSVIGVEPWCGGSHGDWRSLSGEGPSLLRHRLPRMDTLGNDTKRVLSRKQRWCTRSSQTARSPQGHARHPRGQSLLRISVVAVRELRPARHLSPCGI